MSPTSTDRRLGDIRQDERETRAVHRGRRCSSIVPVERLSRQTTSWPSIEQLVADMAPDEARRPRRRGPSSVRASPSAPRSGRGPRPGRRGRPLRPHARSSMLRPSKTTLPAIASRTAVEVDRAELGPVGEDRERVGPARRLDRGRDRRTRRNRSGTRVGSRRHRGVVGLDHRARVREQARRRPSPATRACPRCRP